MPQKNVLIFTKVPLPGFVKTRLIKNTCLSDKDAAELAEAMLKDTIIIAEKSEADIIDIGYFPEEKFNKLQEIVDSIRDDGNLTKPINYYLQIGDNFDEHFSSVVNSSLNKNIDVLIILGSDLPYLDPNLINYTFENLLKSKNRQKIVIGPASGGGIYLVGIDKNFIPNSFTKHKLFQGGIEILQFIDFCESQNIDLILLPPFIDIDLEEDLVSLITFIEAMKMAKSYKNFHFPYYTAEIINKLGLSIVNVQGITRERRIQKNK